MWIKGQEMSQGNEPKKQNIKYIFLERVKLVMLMVSVYNVLVFTYLGKKGVKKENLNNHSFMSIETQFTFKCGYNMVPYLGFWYESILKGVVAIHAICMSMKSNKPHSSALEEAPAANSKRGKSEIFEILFEWLYRDFGIASSRTPWEQSIVHTSITLLIIIIWVNISTKKVWFIFFMWFKCQELQHEQSFGVWTLHPEQTPAGRCSPSRWEPISTLGWVTHALWLSSCNSAEFPTSLLLSFVNQTYDNLSSSKRSERKRVLPDASLLLVTRVLWVGLSRAAASV